VDNCSAAMCLACGLDRSSLNLLHPVMDPILESANAGIANLAQMMPVLRSDTTRAVQRR
jgi:hypothetical protein